jgi:hypothetical protein
MSPIDFVRCLLSCCQLDFKIASLLHFGKLMNSSSLDIHIAYSTWKKKKTKAINIKQILSPFSSPK